MRVAQVAGAEVGGNFTGGILPLARARCGMSDSVAWLVLTSAGSIEVQQRRRLLAPAPHAKRVRTGAKPRTVSAASPRRHGELGEVRVEQVAAAHPAREPRALVHADRAVGAVVDDDGDQPGAVATAVAVPARSSKSRRRRRGLTTVRPGASSARHRRRQVAPIAPEVGASWSGRVGQPWVAVVAVQPAGEVAGAAGEIASPALVSSSTRSSVCTTRAMSSGLTRGSTGDRGPGWPRSRRRRGRVRGPGTEDGGSSAASAGAAQRIDDRSSRSAA